MTAAARIAVIEDTDELRDLLQQYLSEAGYPVRCYSRARDFERDREAWAPDLCIVDLGLPDKDGLGLLPDISAGERTAVLIISGRSGLSDKVAGLELGADDYLTKPFETAELLARVRALLRRAGHEEKASIEDTVYRFSGCTYDPKTYTLTDKTGAEISLSTSEAALLREFLKRPNRLVTRDELREQFGDRSDAFSFDRAIDVRVSRLRAKLRDSTGEPKMIKTIYGSGYILICELE